MNMKSHLPLENQGGRYIPNLERLRNDERYKYLNKEQFNAVTYPLKSCLVLAGAGSGKTAVLIQRIVYLHEELNVPLKNIMAVTFTNKAAKEIKYRLTLKGLKNTDDIWVGTFHSLCFRILMENAKHIGLSETLAIWDETDIQTFLADKLQETSAYFDELSKRIREDENAFDARNNETIKRRVLANLELAVKLSVEGKRKTEIEFKDEFGATQRETLNTSAIVLDQIMKLKEQNVDADVYRQRYPKMFNEFIYYNDDFAIPKFFTEKQHSIQTLLEYFVGELFIEYSTYSKNNHLLDFADLILLVVQLFERYPAIRYQYQEYFQAILVDEFQDTNPLQYYWLSLITGQKTAVMIVGDDDQAIYAFRGSRPEFLSYFLYDFALPLEDEPVFPYDKANDLIYKERVKTMKPLEVIRLEQNYRSDSQILTMANKLIKINQQRLGKDLFTKKTGDLEKVYFVTFDSQYDEAWFVALDIKRRIARSQLVDKEPLTYKDFCIIYRTNRQSNPIEKELITLNIPHIVYGGYNFFKRKSVQQVLHWLQFAVDVENDLMFEKTFNQIPPTKRHNPVGYVQNRKFFIGRMIDALKAEKKKTKAVHYIDALIDLTERFRKERSRYNGETEFVDYESPYADSGTGLMKTEFMHDSKRVKMAEYLTDYALMLYGFVDIFLQPVDKVLHINNNPNPVSALHEAVTYLIKQNGLLDYYREKIKEERAKDKQQQKFNTGRQTHQVIIGEYERDYNYIMELLDNIKQWELDNNFADDEPVQQRLMGYLREVSLRMDKNRADKVNTVSLMTMHTAKGLEFPYVYLVGFTEKIFPSRIPNVAVEYPDDPEIINAIEEERRLHYVAVTRAEKGLTVSSAGVQSKFLSEGFYSCDEEHRFMLPLPTLTMSLQNQIRRLFENNSLDNLTFYEELEKLVNNGKVNNGFWGQDGQGSGLNQSRQNMFDKKTQFFNRMRSKK